MAEVVAGLLTSAVVEIAGDKLSSAIAQQANLCWNFSDDLKDMKDTIESMAAVFKETEKRSVQEESVRLWLKRLKHAAIDISDMMDDYQDTGKGSKANKMPGMLSCFPAARKKMVLANKMKKMRDKLRKINEDGKTYNFTQIAPASQDQRHNNERETTATVNEERIFGRDAEKKEIFDILSASSRHRKDGMTVLPIYGLGGMGKSTLAQLIYNDNQLKYEQRVWVYVSEVFDLKKIGNSIISQLSTDGRHQDLDSLHMIDQRLNELLPAEKKILIVLDDLWQEDASQLDKLKNMLHVDKKGSMVDVLVTTRSESIATTICTNKPYKLQALADDVCWDIIQIYSGFKDKSNNKELEKIGLDIAKKCGGVALAAQALGYMLNKEDDLDGWSKMNNSDIWNVSSGDDDKLPHMKVLPSLQLSYEQMTPRLRLCFSYCAIFSKGHDIYEDDLVHQWIALDFIKEPSDGKKYIKQLLGMSFLQHSKSPTTSGENVKWYTMHDLVHDLARFVVGDELIVIDVAEKLWRDLAISGEKFEINHQPYYRYALIKNYKGQKPLSDILPKNVRALYFSSGSELGPGDGSFSVPKRLCILDFSECFGIIFLSSIRRLKQLKCVIFPELLLLKVLADVDNVCSNLPLLEDANVRELRIDSLENIMSVEEARKVKLLDKDKLSDLTLAWTDKNPAHFVDDEELLGQLVPPTGLKTLNLSGYIGQSFPSWFMGDISHHLPNLVSISLCTLPKCNNLPPLGQLRNLERLYLFFCNSVTKIGKDFCGGKGAFCRLAEFTVLDMEGLEEWCTTYSVEYGVEEFMFPVLDKLIIANCPRLRLTPCPPVCRKIAIYNSDETISSLEELRNNTAHLTSSTPTTTLIIDTCNNRSLRLFHHFTALQELVIIQCRNLTGLPESMRHLTSLQSLQLDSCEGISALPEWLGDLSSLENLTIIRCRGIESLPPCIQQLTNLQTLRVEQGLELKRWCESEENKKLAHINDIIYED